MERRSFFAWLAALFAGLFSIFTTKKVAALPAAPSLAGISALPEIGIVTPYPISWHSQLMVMLDEISAHAQKTGDNIVGADEPRERLIGFAALGIDGQPSKQWYIPLTKIKGAMVDSSDPRLPIVLETFRTAAGRAELAASFPGQRGAVSNSNPA